MDNISSLPVMFYLFIINTLDRFFNFNEDMPLHGRFVATYRCFSVSMMPVNRERVEIGGKIFLPPSSLDMLTRLHVQYPMLFKLTNKKENADRQTHCGVLEFIADEGHMYIPHWMMKNLYLEEGDLCKVENISLPIATYAKFQPQCLEFLEITDPKAVLENLLRQFACLTKGDVIAIHYNNKVYEICVLETKPGNAVSIIECDMNVEFASPVGYQDPSKNCDKKQDDDDMIDIPENISKENEFCPFSGMGNRIDGKTRNTDPAPQRSTTNGRQRGVPDYKHNPYSLRFFREELKNISNNTVSNTYSNDSPKSSGSTSVFYGVGHTLRKGKKDSKV